MSSSDSTNLALGILGVLTIIPIILGFVGNRLPYAHLRYFDELLVETDSFLLSLEEQGIFRKPSTATYYRECLAKCVDSHPSANVPLTDDGRIRQEADRPRMESYCATSIWQQLKGLFNGLSKKLSGLSSSAEKLRAKISVRLHVDATIYPHSSYPVDYRYRGSCPGGCRGTIRRDTSSRRARGT